MLELRHVEEDPPEVELPFPEDVPDDVDSTLGAPGGRALGIRDGEIVIVQADGSVTSTGLPRPSSEPHVRFFGDDDNRMLLANATEIHEIDLVQGRSTLRVKSGLVMQSFAPIAGGFAISPIEPWQGITLYGLDDPETEVLELAIKRVARLSDVADGRALVIGLERGDYDEEDLRTLVVAIRDRRVVPLAGFLTPSRNVQLHEGRIFLECSDGWMELLGLDAALSSGTPVDEYDESTVPRGKEPT